MKALVTGGLGTNGLWIARRLLEEGHGVVAFDNRDGGVELNEFAGEITAVVGDVTDPAAVLAAVQTHSADVIIHLAAVLAAGAHADPSRAVEVNCGGTLAVLEAARQSGVGRVVAASSVAVYSAFEGRYGHPHYEPVDESYRTDPQPHFRVYGASKRMAEQLGIYYNETAGLQFAALRFSMIMTPGASSRHWRGDGFPQSKIIEESLAGRPVRIESGGDQRADWIYVKDLAQAVVRACDAPSDVTGVYNIGSGRLSSLRDIAAAVRRRIPTADIEIGPGLDPLGIGLTYCLFDISRARSVLGYEPEFGEMDSAVEDYLSVAPALVRNSQRSA